MAPKRSTSKANSATIQDEEITISRTSYKTFSLNESEIRWETLWLYLSAEFNLAEDKHAQFLVSS